MTNLSIRTITLSGLALLAVWYALFGGGGIVAGPIDFSENPVGWLVALATLVAEVALLVAVREARRTMRSSAPSDPITPDDRMWAAHLAWLNECAVRRALERATKAS
jgi:drug/metabolite transporter (DMT)-like permease